MPPPSLPLVGDAPAEMELTHMHSLEGVKPGSSVHMSNASAQKGGDRERSGKLLQQFLKLNPLSFTSKAKSLSCIIE